MEWDEAIYFVAVTGSTWQLRGLHGCHGVYVAPTRRLRMYAIELIIYVYTCTCMYIMCVCMYVHVCVCMYVYVCMYVCMYVCTCIYEINVCMYVCMNE